MIDGKPHIFDGNASIDVFDLDETPSLALAEKYGVEAVKGSTCLLKSGSRLIFSVPYHRSGDE